MSCYSSEHNCQNPQPCDCNCTSTTTVACQVVAEKPCSVLYDELFLSDCIIYDGPDDSCYGIKNGDSVKKVFEIIFNKLQGQDCDCNFGDAIITFITDDPNTLCINIMTDSSNICQNVVNQSITSGIIINGKQSYQFAYQGNNYIIKWSDTANRWEIYKETNMTVYLAYLNSNVASPIGPLAANQTGSSLSWISNPTLNNQAYITTRETCPQQICVSIDEENIQFNSYYDTVYNNIYKHAYVSCTGNYTIKWNPFMLVYELFDGITKIATTTVGDLETVGYINWLPVGEISPIKSKKGICPTIVLTCCAPVILAVNPIDSGPGSSVTYEYPDTNFCVECATVTIENSMDGGVTWDVISTEACSETIRTFLNGPEGLWRAKTSCVGGGESAYSQIYEPIP